MLKDFSWQEKNVAMEKIMLKVDMMKKLTGRNWTRLRSLRPQKSTSNLSTYKLTLNHWHHHHYHWHHQSLCETNTKAMKFIQQQKGKECVKYSPASACHLRYAMHLYLTRVGLISGGIGRRGPESEWAPSSNTSVHVQHSPASACHQVQCRCSYITCT